MGTDKYGQIRYCVRQDATSPKHDPSILEAALIGFLHRLTEIERAMEDIRQRIGGNPGAMLPSLVRRKRKVSAASRRRMAAAQRRRWAKVRRAAKD
jgi:hypothetical protein